MKSRPPAETRWTGRPRPRDQVVRVVSEPNKPTIPRNSIDRPGETLRLMAGSPDPADPARLTIPYELDGQAGR